MSLTWEKRTDYLSMMSICKRIPDPLLYKGIENVGTYVERVFSFMEELRQCMGNQTVLIAGHRCTTGMIGAYFNGIPDDQNIFRYSAENGQFHIYYEGNLT